MNGIRIENKGKDLIRPIEVKRHLVALLLGTIAIAAAAPAGAAEDMFDGKWHFSVTPYLWLPIITGTVTYDNPAGGGGSISAEVDPSSYLTALDFAAMVTGEARKNKWLVFTDYMYIHFGGDESAVKSVAGPGGIVQVPININGSASLLTNVWTLAGGYSVVHESAGDLDVFAGTRLLNFSSTLSWNFAGPIGALAKSGSVSETKNLWDGIIGAKGEARFGGSNWFMPYYADIGAGSNNWTWQASLGAGYRFGWGDVVLTMRSLSYDANDNQLNLRMTGPALGASFRF